MSKNSPSKRKYKEAINTAQYHASSGKEYSPLKHFDERQIRIYTDRYYYFKNMARCFDEDMEVMANVYGYTYITGSSGKLELKKV